MLKEYKEQAKERKVLGIPPLPLTADDVTEIVGALQQKKGIDEQIGKELLYLLTERVPPGVDDAAKVKAEFLSQLVKKEVSSELITPEHAIQLLGTMLGGYNVAPLVDLLDDKELGQVAADALKKTLLIFDSFDYIKKKMRAGLSLIHI